MAIESRWLRRNTHPRILHCRRIPTQYPARQLRSSFRITTQQQAGHCERRSEHHHHNEENTNGRQFRCGINNRIDRLQRIIAQQVVVVVDVAASVQLDAEERTDERRVDDQHQRAFLRLVMEKNNIESKTSISIANESEYVHNQSHMWLKQFQPRMNGQRLCIIV